MTTANEKQTTIRLGNRETWSDLLRDARNPGWKRLPVTKLYGEYELVRLIDFIPSLASRSR